MGNAFPLKPEFETGDDTVTLVFIASDTEIPHSHPRSDPVFPADVKIDLDTEDRWFRGNISTAWIYNSTRAGVMACAESFRICSPSHAQCWGKKDIRENFSRNGRAAGVSRHSTVPSSGLSKLQRQAFYLTTAALKYSTAFDAMRYRRGQFLDANRHIGAASVLKLPKEQWKVEAQKLFNTSLARMQLDLHDLAWGKYADYEYVFNDVPDEFQDAHRLLIFPRQGYRNVDGLWLVTINVACVVIFLSSRRYSTPQKRREKTQAGKPGGYHDNLWITIVFKKLGHLALWLVDRVLTALAVLGACCFAFLSWAAAQSRQKWRIGTIFWTSTI